MPRDDWGKARRREQGRAEASRLQWESARHQSAKASRRGAAKRQREGPTWIVSAGVPCEVRKRGEKTWKPYRTTADGLYGAYLWRNEGWYGFASGEWEMKVESSLVQEIPA